MATPRETCRPSSEKIYVVFKGRNPGFYMSWAECHAQVSGFHGNVHKSYNTRAEAESAWLRYWSRRAAFGEGFAASTALGVGVQGHDHGSHPQQDDPTQQLQLDRSQSVQNTPEYGPGDAPPSGMALRAFSIAVAIAAVLWIFTMYSP